MHIEPRRVFHSFHWISPVPTLLFLGKSGNTACHSFKKNNSSSFTAPLFSAWKRDINSQIRSLRPPSLQKRIRDAYNVSIFEILFIWSILNYIPRCESRLRRSWHPFRRGKNLGDVELIRVYGGHNKQRYILTGWGKERRVRKGGRGIAISTTSSSCMHARWIIHRHVIWQKHLRAPCKMRFKDHERCVCCSVSTSLPASTNNFKDRSSPTSLLHFVSVHIRYMRDMRDENREREENYSFHPNPHWNLYDLDNFPQVIRARSAKMEFSFLSRPPREVWKIYSVSRV